MIDKRKIAIIDDHIMFRKGLSALINMFPSDSVVIDAANGKDLLAQLAKGILPDIALVDINMPEMDGYETTEMLGTLYSSVKVIALSTMDSEAAIIKMIRSGAKGYIMKDSDPSELKLAFEEVMRQGYFYNEVITRKVMSNIVGLQKGVLSSVSITRRESEFLKLACSELTQKEIAEAMSVSPRTVDGYREALCEKLGLKTRTGLALYAVKNGIVIL